jgi:PAS domain S-box-containing protein
VVERARAEAGLRESREQLGMALQAARMGIFNWDLASDRIVLTEESVELFGLLPDHRLPSSEDLFRIVHPDDVARHRAAFLEASEHGHEWRSEYRVIRPLDGKAVWMEQRGRRVVDAATGRQHIKGVHWDVTERRLAQERLQGTFSLDTVGVTAPATAVGRGLVQQRSLQRQPFQGLCERACLSTRAVDA